MRVAGSGGERPAAGPILLYWGLPARGRARGSGESRGTERDRRLLSILGKSTAQAGERTLFKRGRYPPDRGSHGGGPTFLTPPGLSPAVLTQPATDANLAQAP